MSVHDRDARRPLVLAALNALGPEVMQFIGATVLITGARGFFGRYVVEALLEQNKRWRDGEKIPSSDLINIIAMDSYAVGEKETTPFEWPDANLYFWVHDVQHKIRGMLTEFMTKKVTHVWHLAGIASPYWYKKLPEETVAVAVDGTRNMLDVAREQGAKFLFTSSSEVYQTALTVPTPESYVGAIPSMNERSCYDVSKLMAETLCYIESMKYGTHCSVVRIFNSFGPGMGEKDRRILPRVASAMKSGKELQVFQPPFSDLSNLPKRTYTPVANTLLGFLKVALLGERVPKGVYNVGIDMDEMDVPELVNRCAEVARKLVNYKLVPPPEHYETEPLRRCPDVRKLRTLGWEPCMSLEDGLRHFLRWADEVYTGEA